MVLIYQLLSAPSCANWECIVCGFCSTCVGMVLERLTSSVKGSSSSVFLYSEKTILLLEKLFMLFLHK